MMHDLSRNLIFIKSNLLFDWMVFSTTTLGLIAIIWALGLVGVVAVDIISIIQNVEAEQPAARGCEFTPAANASKTRCVH